MRFLNPFRFMTIHPTLLLFFIISVLTGTFIQLFIIFIIVVIHELGHFFAATHFKWRIHSIILWAFGGVMETDEFMARPLKEEIIVTVSGPLQHLPIYMLLKTIAYFSLLPDVIIEQALYFN